MPNPAVVQHKSTSNESTASLALAFTSNNTAGNLLVYISMGNQGNLINAATDNNSNTIVANSVYADAGGDGNIRLDYVNSCNSGANTVTAHPAVTGPVHLHIYELSGCVTSSALDQTGSNTQSSTASLTVSTSGATTVAIEAVMAGFFDQSTNDTFSGGNLTVTEYTSNGAGNDSAYSGFVLVTSTGTQQVTATLSSTTSHTCQGISTFKSPAVGDTTSMTGQYRLQ